MSAPDITPDTMSHFSALTGDDDLTILLGAGASASVGLPDWNEFAVRVAARSAVVPSEEAARLLLDQQDPTIVLEAARRRAGGEWDEILRTSLYGESSSAAPTLSSLHLAAAGLATAVAQRTTLATLNFDTLLETALLSDGAPIAVIATDGDRSGDHPTVHHLHGVISAQHSTDAIVAFKDFADLVADTDAWQRRFLSEALARGPLLIAGTTYRDPDIRHWLHLIMRDERPRHPAVVSIVREGLKLSREQFADLESALALEWEAIGLKALTLHDFADVAQVIRELPFAHDSGYETPSQRALTAWGRHGRRSKTLQRRFARILAEDAQALRHVLDVSVHRATLWLADGRGRLARWATEGTEYLSLRDLKRVPTGHDSPWIAGDAIGSEQVRLKDVQREQRVVPTWRSVLAIPVFIGDGVRPDFASAVLTFGLSVSALSLLEQEQEWQAHVGALGAAWGTRLSAVAFDLGDE